MNVKEAVVAAKSYVSDLLSDEGLTNLGLEEIEHNDARGEWYVTLGFSRSWNNGKGVLGIMAGDIAVHRSYRVVTLRDSDGVVTSVKQRKLKD